MSFTQESRSPRVDPALLTSYNKSTPPPSYHNLTIDNASRNNNTDYQRAKKPHPPALADREPLDSLQQKATLGTLHAMRTVWRVATGESCQALPPSYGMYFVSKFYALKFNGKEASRLPPPAADQWCGGGWAW